MPTIVLKDTQGADVGFVLIAGDDSLAEGLQTRDVVLMKLPFPSSSPLAEFIGDHKHIEFSASVKTTSTSTSLSFEVAPSVSVSAEVAISGAGTWSVSSVGSGPCQVLAK